MLRLIVIAAAVVPGITWAERPDAEPELPAYLLQVPDSVTNILIAEASTATLHRYRPVPEGVERLDERYMSVGENGVGKARAWDRRTPLGIYFATSKLDTRGLHEKYGPRAFPLDYPNAWDELQERTGDGIWIHGVDRRGGQRPPRDTDGCIALPNDELLMLEEHLQLLRTPVIITRKIRRLPASEIAEARDALRESLDRWASSFRDGDWHTYLGLYATTFEYRGLNYEEWLAYRLRSAATRPVSDFQIEDVLLLADPEEADLYLSRFRQTIVDANGRIVTTKRLYWRRLHDGAFRIVAEDNG